jgi:hypothetical protein
MGNLWTDIEQDRERQWQCVAELRDYRCKVCGNPIGRDEWDVYYETRICSGCAYAVSKKD